MMMMMMMIDCFLGMVDRRKTSSLIFNQDHCQRFLLSRISDTLRAEFEPVQNLSSSLIEVNCIVVVTTRPRNHINISSATHKTWLKVEFASRNSFKHNEKRFLFHFCFIKLFLFSRYLNFCLNFLVMQKNCLIRNLR